MYILFCKIDKEMYGGFARKLTGCLHADGLRGWPSWLAPTNSEVAETKIGTNQPDLIGSRDVCLPAAVGDLFWLSLNQKVSSAVKDWQLAAT